MVWNYEDSNTIQHPRNCKAWEEAEEILYHRINLTGRLPKCLMVNIFTDEVCIKKENSWLQEFI